MKVRYERGALADLDEVFAFVAADNPKAASQLIKSIEETTLRIAENPQIGRRLRRPNIRKFQAAHYLVVYEIADHEIVVLYIRHDARRRAWEEAA